MLTYTSSPTSDLQGEITISGDKSISHRAIIFASIADGISIIQNCLLGQDILDLIEIFRSLGVKIDINQSEKKVTVHGVGLHGLQASNEPLSCGNSGTSMRLLTGLLSAQNFASTLIGDESLSKRPMQRIADPLTKMSANIDLSDASTAPIKITPAKKISAIDYHLPVASAQVETGIILASLYADSITTIHEPSSCRNHTELLLQDMGAEIKRDGLKLTITPPKFLQVRSLQAKPITVPGDFSSAAFFIVAALITKNSDITIKNLGFNSTRNVLFYILKDMGADIEIINKYDSAEPCVDLRIKSSQLKAIELKGERAQQAIDELPILMIAASCAAGITIIQGAGELKHKESNRLMAMAEGLKVVGIKIELFSDGIKITGGKFKGGIVNSHSDHRIAMSFLMAGAAASGDVVVQDCDNIKTSFPGFVELNSVVGLNVTPAVRD